MIFLNISYTAFPVPWQLSFQKPATTMMEGIIDLHHDIATFLVIIIVFVSFMLGTIFWRYMEPRWTTQMLKLPRTKFQSGHGITHNTLLETVWTIVPTLVLLLIATPSFALIYALDEIVEPQITVRIVGRQWYWTYEYPDTVALRLPFAEAPASESQITVTRADVSDLVDILISREIEKNGITSPIPQESSISFITWWTDTLSSLQPVVDVMGIIDLLDRPSYILDPIVLLVVRLETLNSIFSQRPTLGFLNLYFNLVCYDDIFFDDVRDLISHAGRIDEQEFIRQLVLDHILVSLLGDELSSPVVTSAESDITEFWDVGLVDVLCQEGLDEGRFFCQFIEDSSSPITRCVEEGLVVSDLTFFASFLVAVVESEKLFSPDLVLQVPGFALNSYIVPTEDLYPGSFRLLEVNRRMALPFATNVRLLMTSYDVIHSWAVPAFGIKVDCLPGRLNEYFLNVNYRGIFYGQCSEICGVNHGFMPIKVEVMTDEHFRWWFLSSSLGENSVIKFRTLWQLSPEFKELVTLVGMSRMSGAKSRLLAFFLNY